MTRPSPLLVVLILLVPLVIGCGDGRVRGLALDAGRLTAAEVTSVDIAGGSTFDVRPYDWSPDGRRLAHVDAVGGLWIAGAPAFDARLLDIGSVAAHDPRWSLDGRLIAFYSDDGVRVADPDEPGSALLSDPDDWKSERVVRLIGWLDDETLAYEVHVGTGSQELFEMTVERPMLNGLMPNAGVIQQVAGIRPCDTCLPAALAHYYSPDRRYIAADAASWPNVSVYDREVGELWRLNFPDDATHPGVFRVFAGWAADGESFYYRETTGDAQPPQGFRGYPPGLSLWRAWPATHEREQVTSFSVTDVVPSPDETCAPCLAYVRRFQECDDETCRDVRLGLVVASSDGRIVASDDLGMPVSADPFWDARSAWAPAPVWLPEGGDGSALLYGTAGGDLRLLTSAGAPDDRLPATVFTGVAPQSVLAPSPDGKYVAVWERTAPNEGSSRLRVLALERR